MLSIVIPTHNEERHIQMTIETLIPSLHSIFPDLELIIVDDGSTDKTIQNVNLVQEEYKNNVTIKLLKNIKNRGKGFSVRKGVLAAQGDIVIFTDADLSYDIPSIISVSSKISDDTPVVIGSRILPESQIIAKVTWLRSLSGKIFSYLIQLFMFQNIPDTQCGLKGFTRTIAQETFPLLTIDGFAFDVELLYILQKYNHKIYPVPVKLISNRADSRLNMALDPIRMFIDLFKIRLNDLLGKYG